MSPEVGDVFTAEVAMVTANQLGSVKKGHDTISIGPVDCEKGTQVQLKYLGEEKKINRNTSVSYATVLTEEAIANGYEEYIERLLDGLIPDEPPAPDEVTYTEIDEVDDRSIGYSEMGGTQICLGPVAGEPGDIVKIGGVTDTAAKVLTSDYRGENYDTRFNILSHQYDKLPVFEGDEFTTAITEIDDGTPIGYLKDVPITFPDGDAAIGQKIDARISGFAHDQVIGEIIEKYDEVVRVENAGHWARIQWLRQQGFGDDPMRTFAAEFLGVDHAVLSDTEERIRDTLIAEAIRLGLQDKAGNDADGSYVRAHVTGIRHWVLHKLEPILDKPDDEDDWFRDVLSERTGPTLTFLGDLMKLSNGYYAPGPTRAIMTTESEAVLVSGRPSHYFLDQGLDIEFRGISRIIKDTGEDALKAVDIPVQPLTDYIDAGNVGTSDSDYLQQFIEIRESQEWTPSDDWEAYLGNIGYGFDWGDDAYEVTTEDGISLSLWKNPVEFNGDEFWLKIDPAGDLADAEMVRVPYQYRRQVCLVLDDIGGLTRQVELSQLDDGIRLSCDFAPPRSQVRWLNAIGARWENPKHNKIHWRLEAVNIESVEQAFSKLAVDIEDATTAVPN